MKNSLKYAIACLIPMIVLYGCADDDKSASEPTPAPVPVPDYSTTVKNMEDFTARYMPASEFHTIYTDTTIVGAKGTLFHYKFNNLKLNFAGAPVTPPVEVEFKEIYDQPGMILSSMDTRSNNDLLVSNGFFYSQVFKDSTRIPYGGPTISVPTDAINTDMELFFNTGEPGRSWSSMPSAISDTIINGNLFYQSLEPRTRWINFDYFYKQDVPKTNVRFRFTNPFFTPYNYAFELRSALVFHDINSMMNVDRFNFNNSNGTYTCSNVPEGLDITIFSFVFADGNIYMASKDINSSSDMIHEMTYEQTGEAALIAKINSF